MSSSLLSSSGPTDALSLWRERFALARTEPSLPRDRQPVDGDRRASAPVTMVVAFAPDEAAALASLAARLSATAEEILTAALFALLYRATRETDLAVALFARDEPDLVQALPLFLVVADDLPFEGLLARVRAAVAEEPSWRLLPPPVRSRLWGQLLPLAETPWPVVGLMRGAASPSPACTLGFGLAGDELRIVHDPRRHPAAGTRWLGRHLLQALPALADAPDTRLAEIDFTTEAERAQVLAWGQGGPADAAPRDYAARFEREAAARPEAPAVVSAAGAVGFAELNARANRLACHLRTCGAGPDVAVALCLDRSPDLVAAVLAVFKAGAAVFMLDPSAPAERQATLLKLVGPVVVLSDVANVSRLPAALAIPVQVIDDDAALWRSCPPDPVPRAVEARHRAILFQTSGSTGTPKIVVESYGHWRGSGGYAPGDRTLLKSNAGTTFSLTEAMAVITGATAFVVPAGMERDLPALAGYLADNAITRAVFPPSALALLLDHVPSGLDATLRAVTCIGERVPGELKTAFAARLPRTRLTLGYGCTEARSATLRVCAPDDDPGLVDVGRPNKGMEVLVLDERGRPGPVGLPGEIYLGGLMSDGYLDARAAHEAFVAHPFRPGARLFRTRDLGRWLPDGSLQVLGRVDFQIKIRGYRIEPGEIEAALTRLPAIRAAAVARREDRPGDERLVAYLVAAHEAAPPSLSDLRRHLRESLPAHMVPGDYVFLPALPFTANGKLDRRALPAPSVPAETELRVEDRPQNENEVLLCGLFENLFQRRPLGRNAHFFDLGGHSLLAARFVALAAPRLGRRLPISLLFQAPTVAELARSLGSPAAEDSSRALVCLQPHGAAPPLFALHGWGGEVYAYLDLARVLAPDVPVYGLQAVGLDGRSPRHTTVEAMAEHYAREIRAVRPEGPYHLLGYSTGGWIAYAVAQVLRREGQTVAFLGLLETTRMCRLPGWPHYQALLRHLGRRLRHHLVHSTRFFQAGGWARFQKAVSVLRLHLTGAHLRTPPPEPGKAPAASDGAQFFDRDYYASLVSRYRPGVYLGSVALFLGAEAKPQTFAFWRHLVRGRIHRYSVAGHHHAMLDGKHVRGFAETLQRARAEVESVAIREIRG